MEFFFIRPFSCPAQEVAEVSARSGPRRIALRPILVAPLAALALHAAGAAAAAQPAPLPVESAPAEASTTLRQDDLRVALVAYRLALAGAALCPERYPLTGMLFHHLAEYEPRDR